MDQRKIGKFIADCRREQQLTQAELAKRLSVSDRAVSKWENGKCMPDSSLMLALCKELGIRVNELLSGERLKEDGYDQKLEENLLEAQKQKEWANRSLLTVEIILGCISIASLLSLVFLASFLAMETWLRILLITLGFILGFAGIFTALRIEQVAGYYECPHCHYRYIPSFKSVLFAMHVNRTRYMKCPHCQKKGWQKKTISKE